MKSIAATAKDLSLTTIYQDIKKDLENVENEIQAFIHSPNTLISEIAAYLTRSSGKRMRPALLILCSKLLGYRGDKYILMSTLVETIHSASLIHDDIIDNSSLRRGQETIHHRWGPNITVLLGDFLYIKTIARSLESHYRDISRLIIECTSQMIEGELTEYSMSGDLSLTEDEYLGILGKKTASLFSISCRIGGILAETSTPNLDALTEFGTNLGMSFQIIDDLLDYTGDEKRLGKPVLSDLSEGRITLPLINTYKNLEPELRRRLRILVNHGNPDKNHQQEILELVRTNGALDYTFKKAEEYSRRSKEILQRFPPSDYRKSLEYMLDFILTRSR